MCPLTIIICCVCVCAFVLVCADVPEDDSEMNDAQHIVLDRFRGADTDQDGRLDRKEFVPFVHPFRYDHMLGHLVEDQIDLYDTDGDSKISLNEFTSQDPFIVDALMPFIGDTFSVLLLCLADSFNPEGLPEDELPEWVNEERSRFKTRWDADSDGQLGTEEIKAWLSPNDGEFFEEEAEHLIRHADKDKVYYMGGLNH